MEREERRGIERGEAGAAWADVHPPKQAQFHVPQTHRLARGRRTRTQVKIPRGGGGRNKAQEEEMETK